MTDVYMYADETGNLDYDGEGKAGASTYFGFGTATYTRDHGADMFEAMLLRARLERRGVALPKGFHAVDDSADTKTEVYSLIAKQAPRFDTTFLLKKNALPRVRAEGQMRLYKMAWFLHFKQIAKQVANRNDTIYLVAGTFGTKARQTAARSALEDVAWQVDRRVILCIWTAASSWGLQVADFGLWAVQRRLEGRTCHWHDPMIAPTLQSRFLPWGQA